MEHKVYEIRDNNHISSEDNEPLLEFENINDYPQRFDDVDTVPEEEPKFLTDILKEMSLSSKSVELFCQKFMVYYYKSKDFRKLTENYMILFSGGEYLGIYKTRDELTDNTEKLDNESGLPQEISTIDEPLIEGLHPNDYPERVDEYSFDHNKVPDFIEERMDGYVMTSEGKLRFIMKFVINYCRSSAFRKLVDGWSFIFIDRNYYGIFKNKAEGLTDVFDHGFCRKKGNSILVWDMYPRMNYDFRETTLVSEGIPRYSQNDNGDIFMEVHHLSFTAQCGIGIIENNKPKLLTSAVEFLIDSGASTTRGCGDAYYDIINCKYKEYPFNEDNTQNLNSDVYKPEMNLLNDMIIHEEISSHMDANKNITHRTNLFFNDDAKIIINGNVSIPIKNITMPSSQRTFNKHTLKNDYMIAAISSIGNNFIGKVKKRSNLVPFTRPKIEDKLLGMNIFVKTSPKVRKIFENSYVMTFSEENDKIKNKDITYYREYSIFRIREGLTLFCSNTRQRFSEERFKDNSDQVYKKSFFSLQEEELICENDSMDAYYEKYETIRPLNLFILKEIDSITTKKIEDYINQNSSIDGWITKNNNGTYSLTVKIKGDLKLSIRHIETKENNNVEIELNHYYRDHSREEIKIIMDHKIGEKNISGTIFFE